MPTVLPVAMLTVSLMPVGVLPPAMVVVRLATLATLPMAIVVTLALLPRFNVPAPAVPAPDRMFTVLLAALAPLAMLTVLADVLLAPAM